MVSTKRRLQRIASTFKCYSQTMDRFWSKVDKSGECWLWTAATTPAGYGVFWYAGRLEAAHRVSLKLTGVLLQPHECALHRCDVRLCVRPDHIFVGSRGDNNRDTVAKGRHRSQIYGKESYSHMRGANNPNAKMTPEMVHYARRQVEMYHRSKASVARELGVSRGTIERVVSRAAWQSV